MVERLARAKAEAVSAVNPGRWVIAADTIVAVDHHVLGKPADARDAVRMLGPHPGGGNHEVHTGLCLRKDDEIHSFVDTAEVFLRPMNEAQARWYVSTGEPMDKAGSYAAQGIAALFIERIDGSFPTVMGFPRGTVRTAGPAAGPPGGMAADSIAVRLAPRPPLEAWSLDGPAGYLPMSQGLHLGGRWYVPVLDLGIGREGCGWQVFKDEEDGLPLGAPDVVSPPIGPGVPTSSGKPTSSSSRAPEPIDPPACRFGSDKERAWFLQGLMEPPLGEAWSQWSGCFPGSIPALAAGSPREGLPSSPAASRGHLGAGGADPRPQGDRRSPGRLGGVPGGAAQGWRRAGGFPGLGAYAGPRGQAGCPHPGARTGADLPSSPSCWAFRPRRPWSASSCSRARRGWGCTSWPAGPRPWPRRNPSGSGNSMSMHGERAGAFLGRMLQGLLAGFEADLYASSPGTARTLSRRLPTFAFLHGGRRLPEDAAVEPKELLAALQILAFLAAIQPRMIQIRCLERADTELQAILRELVTGSKVAWCLCATLSGAGQQAKGLFTPLRSHASAAFLNLNRLEDHDLLDLMDDLLQPNCLDSAFRAEVCQASLGNPGMLHRILENAQMEGALAWAKDRGWFLLPRPPLPGAGTGGPRGEGPGRPPAAVGTSVHGRAPLPGPGGPGPARHRARACLGARRRSPGGGPPACFQLEAGRRQGRDRAARQPQGEGPSSWSTLPEPEGAGKPPRPCSRPWARKGTPCSRSTWSPWPPTSRTPWRAC